MTVNNVTGVRADITEMLTKMRELSSKSKIFSEPATTAQPASNFTDVLSIAKNAVGHVAEMQNATEQLKTDYVAGDKNISMSQVIVASQKSKLAFEGLMTVRNKILEAYKEIMNMPV